MPLILPEYIGERWILARMISLVFCCRIGDMAGDLRQTGNVFVIKRKADAGIPRLLFCESKIDRASIDARRGAGL